MELNAHPAIQAWLAAACATGLDIQRTETSEWNGWSIEPAALPCSLVPEGDLSQIQFLETHPWTVSFREDQAKINIRFEVYPGGLNALPREVRYEPNRRLISIWVERPDLSNFQAMVDYFPVQRPRLRPLLSERPSKFPEQTSVHRRADARLHQALVIYCRLLSEFSLPESVGFRMLRDRAAHGPIFSVLP